MYLCVRVFGVCACHVHVCMEEVCVCHLFTQCQVSALMCMDASTLKQIVQSTINPVARCWDASGVC